MNKISIRLTSFLLAIFSYVLIFQNIVSNQEQIPLNTNEQFEINIANTLITKEELALELDKIVDTNNATLIKIATPTNDYKFKKEAREMARPSLPLRDHSQFLPAYRSIAPSSAAASHKSGAHSSRKRSTCCSQRPM